jgi:uncharacterized protein YndB with AHSA1/START domain
MTRTTETTDFTDTSEDFESTTTIAAPPEAVLAALRTPEGVTDWWGPAEGSADVGGTFEVSFRSHQQVIVLQVEPAGEGQVVWSVRETPRTPEWVGTTIVFEVTPAAAGSTLHFRHRGLTPELECFDMCHEGWTHYLASLVSYVETGAGQPSRHDEVA